MTRHWLSRALLVCRSCVKVGSSICHSCIARASAQVVVVGPSLLYRCSVYWTRGHSSARPSPRIMVAASSLVHLFGSGSLVCLFGSWSLACSSVVGVSLVCRWCVTDLSFVHLFVHRSCIARPLVVCHSSVTRLSLVCHSSVTRLSAPVVAVGPSLLCRCSVYWSHGRWLAHPWLVCCSCVIGHGRRSATHAPLVCLLVFPAARLPVALPLVVSTAGPPLLCLLVCLLVRRWSG